MATSIYPHNFKAFQKKNGIDFRITSNKAVLLLAGIIIILCVLAESQLISEQIIRNLVFPLLISYILIYRWAYNEYEKKHHKFIGTAVFTENEISIDNDKSFKWSAVEKLGIGKVKGDRYLDMHYPRGFHGPAFSAGQDAYLALEDNNETKKVFFLFETYKDQRIFKEIIIDQYVKGNIALNTMYVGLGLDYDEIQEIKKMRHG